MFFFTDENLNFTANLSLCSLSDSSKQISTVRIKRSVQAQFNTDISYIAASALSASARNKLGTAQAAAAATSNGAAADPMAQAERNAQENGKSAPAFVAAKTTRKEETQKNDEQLGGDDDDDLM